MKLRSPWIATHIADPLGRYLLDDYFGEAGLPLPDRLPVEDFIDYGMWFQERVAPDLDNRAVVQIAARDDGGFRLLLADGESFFAKRVLMATGLRDHEYRPAQFDGLPRALVSHSCEHTDSDCFRGRHVAVIGRGQSACESAALLHEAGADVEIICRGKLTWNGDPDERSTLRKRARSLLGDALIPPSQVGPFPFNWLVEAPGGVSYLSERLRDRLGRCQDLEILKHLTGPHQPLAHWRSRLTPACAERTTELAHRAARIAHRLFAERPKAFRHRLETLWEHGR